MNNLSKVLSMFNCAPLKNDQDFPQVLNVMQVMFHPDPCSLTLLQILEYHILAGVFLVIVQASTQWQVF